MIYPQNIELQLFLVPERQAAFNDTKSWSQHFINPRFFGSL